MIVGEAMSSGKMMYRDIWEDIGPLSAFFYQILDIVFGKSQLAYQLIALIIVFLQAVIFNRLLLNNKAFNENTYIPSLVYIVCMSANFEFLTPSPVMMSMTFVLLAINNIFKRIDNFTRDELFLNTGLYLGISTLFYFPSFLFFISTLLSLVLFTGAIPRRLILLSFGYFQVLAIVALYYYWNDTGREFYYQFFLSAFELERTPLLSNSIIFKIGLILLVFLLVSFVKLYSRNYYVNFQVKFQSVMLITFLAAFLSLFLQPQLSAQHLIAFIPVVAFFLSHLFLLIEKRLRAEILFAVFLTLIFVYQSVIDKEIRWIGQLASFESIEVRPQLVNGIKGKSIIVLGSESSLYHEASLATPYYDWNLSKVHFGKLEYYDILTEVFDNFNEDLPEAILDLEGVAPTLFQKMPTIGMKYSREPGNLYLLKE